MSTSLEGQPRGPEIRQATDADIAQIHALGSTVAEFSVSNDKAEIFWSQPQLEAWSRDSASVVLVGTEGQRITSFLLAHFHHPTGKATIENLFVDEQYRGRGLGKALLEEGLQQLEAKGAVYATGAVGTSNETIHTLLESVGFKPGKEFRWMGKKLGQ